MTAMTAFGYVLASTAGVLSLALTSIPVAPRLVWNASASVPVGLYRIDPPNRLEVTDLVALRAPEPLAAFLAERGYLPRGAALLKRVAALPGQTVCRTEAAVTVDGIAMGEALARDRLGRPLPVWQGCRTVAPDELFLMNFDVRDSLDGRYFGPLARAAVIGRAIPLYTDEDGDGRFVWRAPTWPEVQP
jgi:conjugative transfer signal peptidase TraF